MLTKKLLLLRAKRTVRALREISKPQRANRHADEAQHLDAQSVEHAANLAIFPSSTIISSQEFFSPERSGLTRLARNNSPVSVSMPRSSASMNCGLAFAAMWM